MLCPTATSDTALLKLPTLVLLSSLVASLITTLGTHTITDKTCISYLGLRFQSKGNPSYSVALVRAKSDQQASFNILHPLPPPASIPSFLCTISRYWYPLSLFSTRDVNSLLWSQTRITITTGRNKRKLKFWVQLLTDWLSWWWSAIKKRVSLVPLPCAVSWWSLETWQWECGAGFVSYYIGKPKQPTLRPRDLSFGWKLRTAGAYGGSGTDLP